MSGGFNFYFVGLFNFFDTKPGRLVLAPDGRSPEGNMSSHYASIYIETDKIKSGDQWWKAKPHPKLEELKVTEFPIVESSTLSVSGISDTMGCWPFGSDLDPSEHDQYVPKLREIDPAIRIDLHHAATIVRMPLRHGILKPFIFVECVVTRLRVERYSKPITITARTDKDHTVKKLVVAPHADVVLANMSNPFAPHEGEDPHFRLYSLLDRNRKADLLYEPTLPTMPVHKPKHRLLDYLDGPSAFPPPSCSNTGCCAGEPGC